MNDQPNLIPVHPTLAPPLAVARARLKAALEYQDVMQEHGDDHARKEAAKDVAHAEEVVRRAEYDEIGTRTATSARHEHD